MNVDEFLTIFREAVDLDKSFQLNLETTLENVPGWDSLAMVSMLATLDLRFNIITSAQKIRYCRTLGDLFGLVESK
jgi:acyl carrier protein